MLALSLGSLAANLLAWLAPFCGFLAFAYFGGGRSAYTWLCLAALILLAGALFNALLPLFAIVLFVSGGAGVAFGLIVRRLASAVRRMDRSRET